HGFLDALADGRRELLRLGPTELAGQRALHERAPDRLAEPRAKRVLGAFLKRVDDASLQHLTEPVPQEVAEALDVEAALLLALDHHGTQFLLQALSQCLADAVADHVLQALGGRLGNSLADGVVHALPQHLDHQFARLRSHAAASSEPSELCGHTTSSELCANSPSLLVNRSD